MIWPVVNLLSLIWTSQYPIFVFQVSDDFFFIIMTTGQELGNWKVSRFSNIAKVWNAIMKQKFWMFTIHQTTTNLQRTDYLNRRTKWYSALEESKQMKSAYFTIHPSKNPPPQNGCRLKSVFIFYFLFYLFIIIFKVPVSHPPLSQFNRTFHRNNRPP
jgi:hypothetical protein